MNSFRIDPTPSNNGIHIVDTKNGYERIYIPFNEINTLIKELKEVLQ